MKPEDSDELTHQGPVERTSPFGPLGDHDHTQVSTDPLVGTSIGDFRVVKKLGLGGMGVVYEGRSTAGRQVAIKVLKPELALDVEYVNRLMNEARAVASLHHPGIVEVLSVGTLSNGRPYLVMEHLAGQSVEEWAVEHAPLPIDEVRSLGAQICSILTAVHGQGIVHRDLKGDNMVWVQSAHGPPKVKLLDFGIAKISKPGAMMMETHSSRMVGTPAVMSPEQIRAEAITARTDLYSLGAVLYRLLTRVYPFESPSMAEVLMKHLNETPADPRELRPDTPEPLAKLILKLLEKDPENRPENAAVVERALLNDSGAAELGDGLEAGPTTVVPVERPNPFSDLDQGQSLVAPAWVDKTRHTAPPAMGDLLGEKGPVPEPPGESDAAESSSPSPKATRSTDKVPVPGQPGPLWPFFIPLGVGLAGLAAVGIFVNWALSPWSATGAAGPAPVVAAARPAPPASALAPAPAPVVVPPVPKAITAKQLLARIDGLKGALKKHHSKNKKAPADLARLRRRVETATEDAQLTAIASDLDSWETQSLPR